MKRSAVSPFLAVTVIALGCDPDGTVPATERMADDLDDTAGTSGDAVALDPDEDRERGASPLVAMSDDEDVRGGDSRTLAAETSSDRVPTVPTQGGLGLGVAVEPKHGGNVCRWERLDDTSGTAAGITCPVVNFDQKTAIAGTCYAADPDHLLVREYATAGLFDLVDDGEDPLDVTGWACQWDTAATGQSNRHMVAALCCPNPEP